jgi:hypothetical protein
MFNHFSHSHLPQPRSGLALFLALGLLTNSVPQEELPLCVPLAHIATVRIPKPEICHAWKYTREQA